MRQHEVVTRAQLAVVERTPSRSQQQEDVSIPDPAERAPIQELAPLECPADEPCGQRHGGRLEGRKTGSGSGTCSPMSGAARRYWTSSPPLGPPWKRSKSRRVVVGRRRKGGVLGWGSDLSFANRRSLPSVCRRSVLCFFFRG